MEDGFVSKIPSGALAILLELGEKFGFDPTGSSESEDFFVEFVSKFNGPGESMREWLAAKIPSLFRFVDEKPRWIQNPNWPFGGKGPLIFVGQIDVPVGLFHDAASFYTFYDLQDGSVRTILQVA